MSVRLKKPRTILLTLVSFGFLIFILLNVMVIQLNASAGSMNEVVVFPQEGKLFMKDFDNVENYKVQIQRKPKTANFDESEDDNLDDQSNHQFQSNVEENSELLRKELNPSLNKETLNKDLFNSDEELKKLQEIEEMEDIGEDYDDDDDDDDEEDEYDYDDNTEEEPLNMVKVHQNKLKTNPVFKPGDFGDIRGLEYYRKPKLKYENLPEPEVKIKPTEAPSLVENGIYWTSFVESQIPKGN